MVEAALAADCQVFSVPRTIRIAGVDPTVIWKNGQPLIELNKPSYGHQRFSQTTVDLLVVQADCYAQSTLVLLSIWVKLRFNGRSSPSAPEYIERSACLPDVRSQLDWPLPSLPQCVLRRVTKFRSRSSGESNPTTRSALGKSSRISDRHISDQPTT